MYWVLGVSPGPSLHGGFQECDLVHGPFYCEHDGVVLLVVGEVSVVYLAMVPDCNDIINVSPPYALFCCCPVEQVLLHNSAMNRLAHGEAIPVSMAVPWTRR